MVSRFFAAFAALLIAGSALAQPVPPKRLSGSFLHIDLTKKSAYVNGGQDFGTVVKATRNSEGWVDDLNGVWTRVGVNQLRISNKGLLVETRQKFHALHNRDLSITHQVDVTSIGFGSFQDGEQVRASGGGRGIYVAAQSGANVAGIRNGVGTFTGTLSGQTSGNTRLIGKWTRIWQLGNVSATRDRNGVDNKTWTATRVVALQANATVTQRLVAPKLEYVQSAFVKRIKGTGVVEMTMDGLSWTPIPITTDWKWFELQSRIMGNPKPGFRILKKGDEIAVDMVLTAEGRFKTSPMEVRTLPVQRLNDFVEIALPPGAQLATMTGGVMMRYIANQDIAAATMLSLHTSRNDVDRISFNGSPNTHHYGVSVVKGGTKFGVDPLRDYDPGQYIFAASFNHANGRVAVVLNGSAVRVRTSMVPAWPTNLQYVLFGSMYGGLALNGYLQEFAFTRNIPSDEKIQEWSEIGIED